MILLANELDIVPSQVLIIVIGGASLGLISWVVKMLIRQNILLDRLIREVFPNNKPTITDQLQGIKDNVIELKIESELDKHNE